MIIHCDDKYEAQKLASLVDSKEIKITSIIDTIQNEVIIALSDDSAHSILLKDRIHVELFADFMQSIIDKEHRITKIVTIQEKVEIEKA